jgi:two-component system NarL family response regulator
MVAVVGAEPDLRAHAASLLRSAGLGVSPMATSGAAAALSVEPGAIVLLVHTGTAGERVRATQDLIDAQPEALVVVAMPDGTANGPLRRALRGGAAGILFDGELDAKLAITVHAVAAGQLAVPISLRGQIAPRALSYREKQVLRLVVLGLTNRQIAGELFLAESTVKTHLSSAFTKLDADSRADATARILDPESGYGVGILSLDAGGAAASAG